MVWLIVVLLIKCYLSQSDLKIQFKYTICLIFILIWATNIHTRLLMVWFSIAVCTVFLYVCLKKWIVHPKAFFGFSVVGILVAEGIKRGTIYFVWGVNDASELRNAELLSKSILSKVSITPKVFGDIIISNFYKLTISTYGLFPICTIVIIWCAKTLLKKWKEKNINLTEEDTLSVILLFVYGLLLVGTICGIPINFGTGIAQGYSEGKENARFSGFTYLRYYIIYFGPILIASLSLLKKRYLLVAQKIKFSVVCVLFMSLYIWLMVLPHLNSYYRNFINDDYVPDDPFRTNYIITVSLTAIMLYIWSVLIKRNKAQVIIYSILCITIIKNCNISGSGFFVLESPANVSNTIYKIYNGKENINILPDCVYTTSNLIATQFMLNDITVKQGYPEDETEEAIFIANAIEEMDRQVLSEKGYIMYQVDNNQYLWIKGKKLQSAIQPYLLGCISEPKTIHPNQFTFGKETTKFGDTIIQRGDACTAEYSINNLIDGDYKLCMSMNPVYAVNDDIGYVEVWLDEKKITDYTITKQFLEDTKGIQIGFSSARTEKMGIKLYLNDHTVINRLTASLQCTKITNQFGVNRDDELDEIAQELARIDLELPLYIVSRENAYYPDSDWSYAEQYLGQEIQECISAERISSFNKNGYIILENDNRNELIFNLINDYKIIYCTEHYSLLIRENAENTEKLKRIGIDGLSKDGKININYFRLSNNAFKNGLSHVLEEGMYRVDVTTNGRNTEQKSIQGDIINSRNYSVSTLTGEHSIVFWLDGNTKTTFNVYEYYTPVSADADIYISKLLWDSLPDGMDLTSVENMAYTELGLEESGYAMYGPYISLDPGSYEVLFEMDETVNIPDILGGMDVCADLGNTVICSTAWDGSSKFVTLQFHLDERTENIEIRYFKSAGNSTIPVKVILKKIHDR